MLIGVAVLGLYGMEYTDKLFIPHTTKLYAIQDIQLLDTIKDIEFATRVDSLYKYLAKEPHSTWDIVFKDGVHKPDLQTGDLLRVTAEDGTVKYYYLKLNPYIPSSNARLGSITWPDMPIPIREEWAQSYGWHGDTIPLFDSLTMNYVLVLPKAYQKIPALTYSTCDINSNVVVNRAISLEGSTAERTITFTVIAEDSITKNVYSVLLKKEQDIIDITQRSTVTSKVYKVSEGNSMNETIKGIKPGTMVAGFCSNITKASELQMLKVVSGNSGSELAETDVISMGDTLIVLSADQMYSTHYTLELTLAFPPNALLTSSVYTISVNGTKGTISGFPVKTTLKTVLANVSVPAGAILTVVDKNDGYQPLIRLSYDTVYVDVQATHDVYFEVISEDGIARVLYQLMPDSRSRDAFVTSDLYSVDQVESVIFPFRQGASVASLLRDVTPVLGATLEIMDKGGFVRTLGHLYKDDKLVVMSEDKVASKVYFFKTWDYIQIPYLLYIISDKYMIDQVRQVIMGVPQGTDIAVFKSNLIPAVGTTIKVMDVTGNESTSATLKTGDYVQVSSKDGTQKAIYRFSQNWDGVNNKEDNLTISIFPNPSKGRVEVRGLEKGNRVRVISPSGMILQDKVADGPSQTISLDGQPSGVYLLEVLKDNKPVSIQKMVKK